MRSRFFAVLVGLLLGAGFLVHCRDILGIAGNTTLTGDAATDVIDFDHFTIGDGGVTNTQGCGATLTPLTALDGVGVLAIAADDKGVFFTNMQNTGGGDVIGWVDGGRTDVTLGGIQPIDVQIDSANVYWTAFDALNGVNGTATIHAWSRTTGQTIDVPVGDDAGLTAGQLALDSKHLYFGEWQTDTDAGVYALALPLGGGTNPPVQLVPNVSSPFHVSAGATKLYFDQEAGTTESGNSLWSAPLDGGAATLVRDQTKVASIALVNDSAYWATAGQNTVEGPSAFSVSIPQPVDVVVDPSKTYFYVISENEGFDEIYRIQIASKAVTKCIVGESISAIAVVTGHVYFSGYTTANKPSPWSIYDLATQ